jgi:hypothetical protein
VMWMRCCLTRENMACDVDDVLRPDQNKRQDAAQCLFSYILHVFLYFCV